MSAAPNAARASDAWLLPLSQIDVSKPELYERDTHWDYFARLRREAPVHYCAASDFGPYWSITTFKDIVEVEANHAVFSSNRNFLIGDQRDFAPASFIGMDPPVHDEQRKAVKPAVSPQRLAEFEPILREHAGKILDGLPRNEIFNWVDRVSIELATQMLAILFDFPFEE